MNFIENREMEGKEERKNFADIKWKTRKPISNEQIRSTNF